MHQADLESGKSKEQQWPSMEDPQNQSPRPRHGQPSDPHTACPVLDSMDTHPADTRTDMNELSGFSSVLVVEDI